MISKGFKTIWGRIGSREDNAKAYRLTFRNPAGLIVLADLLGCSGVAEPAPMIADPFAQGRVAGRRDVGLHIQERLNLSHEELYDLLKGRSILKPEDFQQ